MRDLIITKSGKRLIADTFANDTNLTFTKVCSSDEIYEENNLVELEQLENIKQEADILSINRTNAHTVEIIADLMNIEILEDYEINTLGIFAKNSENEEILFGVCVADEVADVMTAFEDIALGYSYRINIAIDNADKINIMIGSVTDEVVKEVVDKVEDIVGDKVEELVGDKVEGLVGDKVEELVGDRIETIVTEKIEIVINTLEDDVNLHKDSMVHSEKGVHGLRVTDTIEYKDSETGKWVAATSSNADDEEKDMVLADILTQVSQSAVIPSDNLTGTVYEKLNKVLGLLNTSNEDDKSIGDILDALLEGNVKGSSVIKKIQRGSISAGYVHNQLVNVSEYDISKSILINDGYVWYRSGSEISLPAFATMHNSTYVRITALSAVAGAKATLFWQLIEFN